MMADAFCGKGEGYDSIHPPNVVLVSSTQTSPGHDHDLPICSPLSTAPNSPFRGPSYDDDEDEEEEEISPQEIQELLDTPASRQKHPIRMVDVPFDEGNHTRKDKPDPLLGNPRLYVKTPTTTSTKPAIVSPAAATMTGKSHVLEPVDDIDAYRDEEDDADAANKEEKKVDDAPRLPIYTRGFAKTPEFLASYPRVVPHAVSEDESVPMDERPTGNNWKQQQSSPLSEHEEVQSEASDFIECTRSGDDDIIQDEEEKTPMKKALRTAEREVQEMERRVQLMLEQRRQTSQRSQQRFVQEEESFHDRPDPMIEIDGEPPSLSPGARRNASMDSGTSSYYYDGSAIASSSTASSINNTTHSSINNTTLDTTASSLPPAARRRRPKDNTDYYLAGVSSPTNAFDALASSFEQEGNNGSFAQVMSGTSKAFTQVTDDLTNFLVGPASPKQQSPQYPPEQRYPPVSPSHDSDCTPNAGNLSPRSVRKQTYRNDDDENIDVLFSRQRASAKLARARSLISERQSKSPTSVPPFDPKQRARQVMNKREREQQSLSRPSSTTKRSISSAGRVEGATRAVGSASRVSNNASKQHRSSREAEANIPFPPTLHRIAAMMEESLGGGESSAEIAEEVARDLAASNAAYSTSPAPGDDWPTSVSQLVEEYQTAITASLRNLSMEEVSGLAAAAGKQHVSPEFGKGTMVSPGVSVSPPSRSPIPRELNEAVAATANNTAADSTPNKQTVPVPSSTDKTKNESYDNFMEEMTLGACLQMPDLNHPPLQDSHPNSTTAQNVAGLLTCERNTEYEYHDQHDEEDRQLHAVEHHERALFAKQLSERLLTLSPNTSTDKSGSIDDPSPAKFNHVRKDLGLAFVANEYPGISLPKRTNASMLTSDSKDDGRGGLFASNVPRDLPISDDQPSMLSEAFSWEHPSRGATPDRSSQSKPTSASKLNISSGSHKLSSIKPTMVESIDNETGISKGDVMLSLLCDNSFYASMEKPDSWAWRVREAILRGREMRRTMFTDGGRAAVNQDGSVRDSRRSLPVDVDDVRVVGGIHNVASIQAKALGHMDLDEFEQALELYEDIIFNYYSFFEQVLAKRDEFSSEDVTMELSNFKPYIGASLHNLGVIHLLKGDYEDAFSFFKRAVDNRRACLGEGHSDTVTSLVRLATCRFAMDNFADAHTSLELALALAGSKAKTTNDYCQLGEILNNLGCLSYMCGQPSKAMKLFREALDVQLAVLNSTLYGGSMYSAHSATLNISITRGNIGFLALVLKDVSSGIVALESALREQRLLLNGAHVTLVSTMDHLAVANLLEGRTQKAIKMLRRIYELQRTAHGANDPRTMATRQKILTIRGQQMAASPNANTAKEADTPVNVRSPREAPPDERKVSRSKSETPVVVTDFRHTPQAQRPLSQPIIRQASDGSRDPRSSSNSVSTNGNSGGSKVNSVFKAFRSLGRKKAT
ncbi:repeat-containing protein [Seminavis robusta]|uniref:Repeat-containing protein n=1 Tax=Seminavis robusta TaxID=568900 RepID=A0A9N8DFW9_9STRA|nr:repeat-containing protein [Seminavis robusta]|eukprot:Sro69_g038530.1 repeat-containing protein (1452) ;mRNA; r:47233-51857